jgi:mycothiol synthase
VAVRIEQVDRLQPSQIEAVLALRDQIAARDGSSPLSDHVIVGLRDGANGANGANGARHLLAWDGPALQAYAHLEADGVAEVAVAPGADPGALLDELISISGPNLSSWARGEQSVLATELPKRGFVLARELVQMRRRMSLPVDEPTWPAGVSVRTFVVGQDEYAWLQVNNRAFADHPDQAGWTIEDISARERQAWFDPDGFFLAERNGELVGFHWTKVHRSKHPETPPIGEIYVIGVDPVMQGQHLGAALALRGLGYLRDAGMPTVMLYVEATNLGAIGLYERLGFTQSNRDRWFKLP